MNIISYGNYWTELDLDNESLTIVVGKNGSGKSSLLLDTICFGLFGKPFRNIKKGQIVNSITKKNCLVEIYFSIGNDEYQISRGIKPAIFEIIKNGSLMPQDSKTGDYQDILERDIIKCNFKSFVQVVCLGAKYVPFLSLTTAERRAIIENILDLEVFSKMNVLFKNGLDGLKDTIAQDETKKQYTEKSIALISINNAIINNDIENEINEKHNELIQILADINLYNDRINAIEYSIKDIKIDDLDNIYNTLCINLKDYGKRREKGLDKLGDLKSELHFYNNHENCPTCKQTLEPDFLETKKAGTSKEISRYEGAIETVNKLISDIQDEIENLAKDRNEYRDQKTNIIFHQNKIKNKTDLAKRIEKEIELKKAKLAEEVTIQSDEALVSELNAINNNLEANYKERIIARESLQLLKDNGIKANIISSYIKDINTYINKFLADMDFFCEFYLDENFNETIKSRYRDEFTYDSFSEGQKLRIDLAILFAWRELAKKRNSIDINILIFDEILSGALDVDGVQDLITILKNNKNAENIFVITHDTLASSIIENKISVEMIQNFSHIFTEQEEAQ